MASEVVITSVPRGVKLGRTGFQVVMRTAGVSDGMLSSLEQLAGYRHVFPQGSGRNPLIYSYRLIRSPAGELRVLGRTVDAGNDFSNRSNKLAHLLAIDGIELNGLQNSSPAAVLAAIDSRLLQTWQGGPEERPSSFPLPAAPVPLTPCSRWGDVKGDAGWAGLIAQRAVQGQPSLLVAPDCSPMWCRRLLELFQEVLSLLPPDSRWKTTFETTVVGASSSLLRGTYAGSPESAAGHTGLLVVDLSQRAPLPANAGASELIAIAREGRKRPVAGSAPPLPKPDSPPILPTDDFDVALSQSAGQGSVELARQPKAPVAWDDDGDGDDVPRSRLGWYIGGGMVLLGTVLVSALLGSWYWYDGYITNQLQRKIEDYAEAVGDQELPDDATPTVADWNQAYGKDGPTVKPDDRGFPLLLSALRSKPVGKKCVQDKQSRQNLLRASDAFARNKVDAKSLVDDARNLGLSIRDDFDESRCKALAVLLSEWLTFGASESGNNTAPTLDSIQVRVDLAEVFVDAAFAKPNAPGRANALATAARKIWPAATAGMVHDEWQEDFAKRLELASLGYSAVEQQLRDLTRMKKEAKQATPLEQVVPKPRDKNALAKDAFAKLRKALSGYRQMDIAAIKGAVVLAKDIDVDSLRLRLELPTFGSWKPEAIPDSPDEPRRWTLVGTPGNPEAKWATLILNSEDKSLVYERASTEEGDAPPDVLFVPIRFKDAMSPDGPLDIVMAAPEVVQFARGSVNSLADLVQAGTVMIKPEPFPLTDPALWKPPATLEVLPGPELRAHGLITARRPDNPDGRSLRVVDVIAQNKSDGISSKTALDNIWLESFELRRPAEKGTFALEIAIAGPNSHPRQARTATFKRPPKGCTEEKWRDIVRAILRASPYKDLHRTRDETASAFVSRWVGPEPTNNDEKNDRASLINSVSDKGLEGWYRLTTAFLFKDGGLYEQYTRDRTTTELGARPPLDPRPKEDDPDKNKIAKWKETQKQIQEWDDRKEDLLRSSVNIVAFLKLHTENQAADPASLAAAVVVLELCAREHDDTARQAMSRVSPASLFSATITLPWMFPSDSVTKVPRLLIKPFRESDTPTATPPAPATPPDLPPPSEKP